MRICARTHLCVSSQHSRGCFSFQLADNRELSTLNASVAVFLKHYVRRATVGLGDGREGVAEEDRPGLLRKRITMARNMLTRPSYAL